jgi:hypothetical protein
MKATVTLLVLLALLAGCVAAPAPEQPAGAMGTFNDNTYFQHDVEVGGALTVAGTPIALVSGSTINAASLKVVGTPVVVQVGALAAGARMVCGSTTITGTGVLPTTLATPQYVNLSLAADVTGNCQSLSYTNTSATVTAKCYNSALTPAPATTPVAVNWCAIGK